VSKRQLSNLVPPDDARAILPLERSSFSRSEFALRNSISLALYNKLKQQGLAPEEMQLGTTIRISREAELKWQRERSTGDAELKAGAHAVMVERARHAGRLGVQSDRHVSKRGRATSTSAAG
jgi:hypothetical protein